MALPSGSSDMYSVRTPLAHIRTRTWTSRYSSPLTRSSSAVKCRMPSGPSIGCITTSIFARRAGGAQQTRKPGLARGCPTKPAVSGSRRCAGAPNSRMATAQLRMLLPRRVGMESKVSAYDARRGRQSEHRKVYAGTDADATAATSAGAPLGQDAATYAECLRATAIDMLRGVLKAVDSRGTDRGAARTGLQLAPPDHRVATLSDPQTDGLFYPSTEGPRSRSRRRPESNRWPRRVTA